MKIKQWYTATEISKICIVSVRTIERRRDKLIELNPDTNWFKMKTKPYRYSFEMLGEFISKELFELVKMNRQQANTIECLFSKGTLEHHLSYLPWDYFVTIAYQDSLSRTRCFSAMHELYEMMEANCFNSTTRMFFTTEPFSNRNGHHNHLILKFDGKQNFVTDFIKKYIPNSRIDVKRYDRQLAGIFYACKEGRNGEDWDLLGNNLTEEGKRLLNDRVIC